MTRLTVEVTAEDIAHGWTAHCQRCPIALAITRLFPHAPYLSVGNEIVLIGKAGGHLPKRAKDFVGRFDDGLPVDPFMFLLDVYGDLPAEVTP